MHVPEFEHACAVVQSYGQLHGHACVSPPDARSSSHPCLLTTGMYLSIQDVPGVMWVCRRSEGSGACNQVLKGQVPASSPMPYLFARK